VAGLQWLPNPSEISGDNLNNAGRGSNRTFRNKRREYSKEKLMSLKQTIRTKISETFVRAYINLRSVTNV
jgi:hypothetical protein